MKHTISILVIYKKFLNVDQSVHNCSEKISYLFKFIQFSTRRYAHYKWVNWYSCAMLPWKKVVLIFVHQKWLGLADMGNYHSELLMLFNLAFLMKCKYSDYEKYVGRALVLDWFNRENFVQRPQKWRQLAYSIGKKNQ